MEASPRDDRQRKIKDRHSSYTAQLHGDLGGRGGIGGVAVGTDLAAVGLGDGRAADHDLDPVAKTRGLNGTQRDLTLQ